MMVTDYFDRATYTHSSINGMYILQSPQAEYYACAYKDRDSGKAKIMNTMKTIPGYRKLIPDEFDFHHIVEKQLLADISPFGLLQVDYEDMPTIMLHKDEHKKRYDAILHIRETRLLYMPEGSVHLGSSARREEAAIRLYNSTPGEARAEFKRRIGILKEIHEWVYEDDENLRIISANVLDQYSRRLNV